MTDLYFVRHGQSEANLVEIFAGISDSPLTELGKKQALATAEFFNEIHPDIVYASDLSRAYDTGLAIAEKFNIDIIPDKRLREINGGYWEGKNYKYIAENHKEDFDRWLTDIVNAVCSGGESTKELHKRVCEVVVEIAEKNDGKVVVIASHGTPIRILETFCRNLPIDEIKNIPWVTNASVTHARFDNGKWELVSRSMDEHLGGMVTALPSSI